mmetsp:Transcript_11601/g.36737  ORF Transcript_11601/g.36737 Transcript_11601/m.36737 type:complete len:295 (-) Transcript_11601:269-1153(-)
MCARKKAPSRTHARVELEEVELSKWVGDGAQCTQGLARGAAGRVVRRRLKRGLVVGQLNGARARRLRCGKERTQRVGVGAPGNAQRRAMRPHTHELVHVAMAQPIAHRRLRARARPSSVEAIALRVARADRSRAPVGLALQKGAGVNHRVLSVEALAGHDRAARLRKARPVPPPADEPLPLATESGIDVDDAYQRARGAQRRGERACLRSVGFGVGVQVKGAHADMEVEHNPRAQVWCRTKRAHEPQARQPGEGRGRRKSLCVEAQRRVQPSEVKGADVIALRPTDDPGALHTS